MTPWWDDMVGLRQSGEPFVIVTVVATRGSTPREAGALMLVTDKDIIGTIGGGQLEYQCAAIACNGLASSARDRALVRRFTLGADMGQCCGGVADVLFEYIDPDRAGWIDRASDAPDPVTLATMLTPEGPARYLAGADPDPAMPLALAAAIGKFHADEAVFRYLPIDLGNNVRGTAMLRRLRPAGAEVAIFGAGHVGSALVNVLVPLGVPLRWIDSRADVFTRQSSAHVTVIRSDQPQQLAAGLARGSMVLIMTHSHPLDLAICAEVLPRDDLSYCGLIGSISKRRQFERRLRQLGLTEADLARLTCPIGVEGIDGKQPAEIAISVAAQLLRVRAMRAADRGSATTTARAHR